MKAMVNGAILLAITLPVGSLHAKASDPYGPARQSIEEAVNSDTVQSISVAVFRNGRIDWEQSFGWVDRENKIKATPHTIYSIASISKPFTATALMTLVSRGKIALDGPANDYLGGAKLRARIGEANDATVLRVADHTAGLPFHAQFFYYNETARRPAADETIRTFGQIISRPGERYFYSNLGYGILGDIIARQTSKSYADAMADLVFKPLQLNDTSVGLPKSKTKFVAARYSPTGNRLPYYDTDHAGASEVFTSAHDLIRFAAFHLKAHLPGQKAILSNDLIDQMHANTASPKTLSGYGIGFETSTRKNYKVVSHGGFMPGVTTQMILIPDKKTAIVVLSNTASRATVDKITDSIAATILPGWSTEADTDASASETKFMPPVALVGTWVGKIVRHEGDLPVTLEIDAGGAIKATIGNHVPISVQGVSFADNRLTGAIGVALQAKQTARFQNTIRFDVKLEGVRMYGAMAALDDLQSATFTAGLTYWVDLQKTP
jgi:CubicO group peptidase (beta-lactamase class C family)